jgi:hypothetical protein
VEDRYNWLPAGLEGSRLEPDDRASQRAGAARGKSSDRGPTASGQEPYDPNRPESKLGKSKETARGSGSAKSGKPAARKPDRSHQWTEISEQGDTPAAEKEQKPQWTEVSEEGDAPAAAKPEKSEPRPKQKPQRQERKPQPQAVAARREGSDGRSTVDAMGQDKHRQVVGERFGASRARQLAYYGIFIAFVIGAYLGLKAAADQLDKAPAHDPDQAPWSEQGARQGPLGGFVPPGHKGPARFQ